LAKTQLKRKTFHQICSSFLCCFRRNRLGKLGLTILHISSNSWSKMLLWVSNSYGKHSLRDLLTSYRYIHQRYQLESIFILSNVKHWCHSLKISMGYEMDEQRFIIPSKIGSIRCCLRNLFLRIFLRHFLA